MTRERLKKWWGMLFPSTLAAPPVTDRSSYERFALPYAFKPRLSLAEALVATLAALLRIVLGSFLFGVWGAYTWWAWVNIPNLALRAVVLLPLFLAFLVAMAVLMTAIAALQRMIGPRQS